MIAVFERIAGTTLVHEADATERTIDLFASLARGFLWNTSREKDESMDPPDLGMILRFVSSHETRDVFYQLRLLHSLQIHNIIFLANTDRNIRCRQGIAPRPLHLRPPSA